MKVPQCPNCKHTSFEIYYVKRYRKDKSEASTFKEYATELYELENQVPQETPTLQVEGTVYQLPTNTIIYSSSSSVQLLSESTIPVSSPPRSDYLQVVLECSHCGYTIVINMDEWKLLNSI